MTPRKWFLLDNNLMRLITRKGNERMLTYWNQWLVDSKIISAGDPVWLQATQFSLLEALGVVIDDIPEFSLLSTDSSPADDGLFVHDHALAHLTSSALLQKEHLLHRYEICVGDCSVPGKTFFSQCFKYKVDSTGFIDTIKHALAVDFMLEFGYPKECFKPVHLTFSLMLKAQAEQNGDAPWFRLFEQMQSRLSGRKLNQIHTKPRADEIKKNVGLKKQQDRLDLEVIQFAVSGRSEQGKKTPVQVFTGDPPEKIKDRIALAKTGFQVIREKLEEEEMDASIFDSFIPGWVHCFDSSTGIFIESIEVSSIQVL